MGVWGFLGAVEVDDGGDAAQVGFNERADGGPGAAGEPATDAGHDDGEGAASSAGGERLEGFYEGVVV